MKPKSHRFSALDTSEKVLAGIRPENVRDSLVGVAQWLEAAVEASGRAGKCCRNTVYHSDGRVTWLYPNSNTGELISVWLDLAQALDRPDYAGRAEIYADTMLEDSANGLYRGEHAASRGLPWYWTDGGTYAGHYAMRLPFHFHRLHTVTGKQSHLDICDIIGRTLLAREQPGGLVSAAWHPKDGWLREARVGCRYVYAAATFATLWRITGDRAYLDASERATRAMLAMQNADGSFFQAYDPRTLQAADASIKLHFVGYILSTIEEAHGVTGDPALIECARRVADHLAGVFYYRHCTPYCIGRIDSSADLMEAESANQVASNGLFWLADKTGEGVYLDMAAKLWMDAWIHQVPADRPSGWAGAILRGIRPDVGGTIDGVPTNRPHLHFDPTAIARSDLWATSLHVFASKRLLGLLAPAAPAVSPEVTFA